MNANLKYRRRRHATALVAIAVMCAAFGSSVRAQNKSLDMRSLIEQALGEPCEFTIVDRTLGEAIGLIADQTGVPLRVKPGVMDLAPRGADTVIRRVEITNMPLRQGLESVLSPLGMTYVVRDDHVEILAGACLAKLGRRVTWEELDTLTKLSQSKPGVDSDALARLKLIIQFRVPMDDPWSALTHAIRDVGAGGGDVVLAQACKILGWTWTLDGKRIVVSDGVSTVRNKLTRQITLRMTNRPLLDVLHAVGERIGVDMHAEPGLMASLPRHLQENFSLNVQDDAALQVIDAIAAYTGLGYLIEPNGVFFFCEQEGGVRAKEHDGHDHVPTDEDPIVAKMTTTLEDGKTIDWLIRRSELPKDLREMREKELAELFRSMRRVDPQP